MEIENVILESNILPEFKASCKEDAIKKICEKLKQNECVENMDQFFADVMEREAMISTGIGNGIAIPHGKSNEVMQSTVAFARCEEGIDWGDDGEKVYMIFLLAIEDGKNHATDHLRVLATLSTKLMDDKFINGIKNAKTQNEIYNILKSKEGE